jgi:hypothetical protein
MSRTYRVLPWRTSMCAAVGGLALIFANCSAARAADAAKEIATAAQHAAYAADATVITTVHAHLHHTVNCLVGPGGKGYDAKELNPCKEFGKGAIPDTEDPAKRASLQAALNLAEQGLKSNDLATAKKTAAETAAALRQAE